MQQLAAPRFAALGSVEFHATNPNLYVANAGNSDVTVYAHGRTKVLRTISQGVNAPQALGFGP
jgi:DNA-binding beta-propeller fold protein YncE